jgi:hypothetical protein
LRQGAAFFCKTGDIVDLGIPPGFDVDASAFEVRQQNGQVAKFDVAGNQVILYLRELSESAPFQFSYSLRAKYPLRVQTPRSAVYEYYHPTIALKTNLLPFEFRIIERSQT